MLFELKEMATEIYAVPVPGPHRVMKATCPGDKRRGSIGVVAGQQEINLPTALVTHVHTSLIETWLLKTIWIELF